MMIVMLVVSMFTPNVVKKRTGNKKPSGSWECYLNANNEHISVFTDSNGKKTTLNQGTYCTFKPQENAEEYLVTALGGGGGGASGTSLSYDAVSYGDAVGYRVQYGGKYDILLIGGGGGGSANIGSHGMIGGSAGEIKIYEDHKLDPGYYVLKAGEGGIAGGLEKKDAEVDENGDTDEVEVCKHDSIYNTAWLNICDGGDGKESLFYDGERKVEFIARGGYGGAKNIYTKATGSAGFTRSDTNDCSSRATTNINGGYISDTTTKCKKALESLQAGLSYVGRGGNGSASEIAYPGYNGIAMIRSALFYSGGGGKAGGISFSVIKDIKDEVKVIIGKGGKGADIENTNGFSGENTSFGYYLTAKGGDGGEVKAQSSTSKTAKLNGEAGMPSPYSASGLSYAAGGNGGWAYSIKNTSQSKKWGEGEPGNSGYVRVEWN